MRILIYGAGALGQALGCLLASRGEEIDLVLRPRFVEAIRKEGLAVTGIFGDFLVPAERLGLHATLEPVLDAPFDYALITTKTYDTEAAAADLARLLRQDFFAVSVQNGCGNLETVLARFGGTRSLAARVITGFEIERPGLVRITVSADAVHIGGSRDEEIPGAAVRLSEAIDRAGLPCVPTAHIRRDLFAKLLYNCALNPLGAILGVHYGALADRPETREIMDRVIEETFAVIEALGGSTPWPTPDAYREVFYAKQIPATYHHRPSMLQDLEQGKPTEVEAMTGYVSAQGERHGIATPACDLLTRLVRFKSS